MKKTRHVIQGIFLVLILLGVYGLGRNMELWCPFGGVECLSLFIHDGKMMCALAASNFFILGAVLLLTLVLKRAFCGYMCPLGALAEGMRCLSKKFKIKQVEPSPKVDRVLSLTKYVILVLVLVGSFKATELIFRDVDPCFAMLGYSTNEEVAWSSFVFLGIFIGSALFISMPFCRWFCPFAAVLNLFSRVGLTRIHRNTETCIDCGKCTKACPMQIDVAKCQTVTAARCITCGECVTACPVQQTPTLAWRFLNGKSVVQAHRWIAAAIVLTVVLAVAASQTVNLPTFNHTRDITRPTTVEQCTLKVQGVECSGSARQLIYFLDRDDLYAVGGYLNIKTSPGSGFVDVTLTYDPSQTDPQALTEALVEPYYDTIEARWRQSPFEIEGYDPLAGL